MFLIQMQEIECNKKGENFYVSPAHMAES